MADKPKRKMRLNAQRRYPVRGGGDADTQGVLSTTDVFGLFPDGEIGRLDVSTFRRTGAVLWGHDGNQLPVGRATWIEFGADGWTVGWKWAENDFAQQVKAEWDAGMLTAMSMGMSVAFDEDWEIERVALREASVVAVGADEGAYVAQWSGPGDVMRGIRAGLDVRAGDLTGVEPARILDLAASLRSATRATSPETEGTVDAKAIAERAKDLAEDVVAEPVAEEPAAAEESAAAIERGLPSGLALSSAGELSGLTNAQPATHSATVAADADTVDVVSEEPAPVPERTAEQRRVLELARDLVPTGFDIERATPNEAMRAALSWERSDAGELDPVTLAEEFGRMCARRAAALAGLAQANEQSEAAASEWAESNKVPERGTTTKAQVRYMDELRSSWKRMPGADNTEA